MAQASAATWRMGMTADALRRRAAVLAKIRAFFSARGVVELDAPVLARHGVTDPQLASFCTISADGETWQLQTSPESFAKRALASGAGSLYSLGHVFRDDPIGRHHNPEFLLLEWYRVGFDADALMRDIEALLDELGAAAVCSTIDYAVVFHRKTGVLHTAGNAQLVEALAAHGIDCPVAIDEPEANSQLIDLLFACVVQPALNGLVFVTGYPADQAVQGTLDVNDPSRSTRFELFWDGVELANGWEELTDAAALQQRFDEDNKRRQAMGKAAEQADAHLLAALAHGLPACSGVALGVDRLLMCLWGAGSLSEVMPFTADRA